MEYLDFELVWPPAVTALTTRSLELSAPSQSRRLGPNVRVNPFLARKYRPPILQDGEGPCAGAFKDVPRYQKAPNLWSTSAGGC